ncbi:hypothetical protein BFP72_08700 [Reichenbachiella sp. 5M10]|uniref:DoxX-like family protein n=1 Tax=Reichenbachiella sp. 5M10 TaxID=1889772 RepID=UPI000C14BFAB|nr:DoxX-like family protein [Reichenbachiella sp. 5M10]PIB35465.1 hypothetical protein BFP72_08700 [Reichenbachiella sp. 5M10]
MKTQSTRIKYLPKIIVSAILIQTLWFKFGIGGEAALNESKQIFENVSQGLFDDKAYEPLLRIGTGLLELTIAILLFTPLSGVGALLGSFVMLSAIASHLLWLGLTTNNDGGLLVSLAAIVLLCCIKIVFDERKRIPFLN